MLSIICCSINNDYLNKLQISINNSIDLNFELLIHDNKINNLSISEAYNKYASIAQYDYLVFVHEDVEFLNKGWANNLIQILANSNNGIVGVAGSTYLPSVPSGWYLPDEKYNKVFIHQGFKYKEAQVRLDNQGLDMTSVYLLDGVFLAMRKDVWQEFPFDSELTGFHAYDVDISQRVSAKYQNIFTNQIEILHKSEGKVDKTYFDAILNYKKKYFGFKYPKREYIVEIELLKQLYKTLRCYDDKMFVVKQLKPYRKMRILGIKGYFQIYTFFKNAK